MPDKVKVMHYLPADLYAWLRWQAATERRSASAIIEACLRQHHAACSLVDPSTPPVSADE